MGAPRDPKRPRRWPAILGWIVLAAVLAVYVGLSVGMGIAAVWPARGQILSVTRPLMSAERPASKSAAQSPSPSGCSITLNMAGNSSGVSSV